ncbi:hypothetical protein AHAS_Ahas20G0250400 [Arachis hypogaea]
MEPSRICHGSALTQEAKLFTNQRLNSEKFVVSAKVASALFSSVQDHHVLNCMFENAAGGAGSSNLHVPNQDHEVLDGSPVIVAADTDDDNPAGQVERLHDLMTYPDYGPLRAFTPTDLRECPIRRGYSAAAWVISWLDPEGMFNALEISGVLDDSTLRGRTTVSLAGGPFNATGSLVKMWAKQWQRLGISRK